VIRRSEPVRWIVLLLLFAAGCARSAPQPVAYNAELEYLEVINEAGPPEDPRSVFLLMAEYLSANRLQEGIHFIDSLLEKHDAGLSPAQRALYLSSLGILRARHAEDVPLLQRIGWVNETIEMLESAKKLGNNEEFMSRFAAGIVYAQLPDRFEMKEQAYRDLDWVVQHRDAAPEPGLLREAYFQLARLHETDGNTSEAGSYLERSGYDDFEKPLLLLTAFAANEETGHTFHPRRLREVVPGRVFALSGFEFSEYHFVISEDGRELISIDAGTRPDSARAAYEHLRERVPNLPPLTAVFVTHAHWDHIGGHGFFRELNAGVTFYSRDNFRAELDLMLEASVPFDYFFGSRYGGDLIADYSPDVTIAERREVEVGGSRFELIPIPGGETPDGIFVYMPQHGVLFAGDFVMPFIGAPFFEEGNVPGLLESLDIAVALDPDHILHGHEPLTRYFDSSEKLANVREHLAWLHEETLKRVRSGSTRARIHHENLIPPGLLEDPDMHFLYLVLRENFINRVYDQNVGYWEWDLAGMDHLSAEEHGAALTRYLGLSEPRLAEAVGEMLANGDYHLAARIAGWALTQFPESADLTALRTRAFLKLKEKYQFINPFKLIVYSEVAGDETPQLEPVR
jgi:glyoxylase-like metal-dependent hydrolase (beta-lactamase superfamily II)